MFTHRITTLLLATGTAIVLTATVTPAQGRGETGAAPSWATGALSVQFGIDRLGLTELNKTMTASGRPAFASEAGTIGISGYARFGRVLIGGTGETAIPQRELGAGFINKIWYGTAAFDAGYAVVNHPMLLIYPQGSLGMKHSVLQMERGGDFTYADGVSSPGRGLRMSSWRATAGYGVVGELRLRTRATGDFAVGVRGGYSTPVGGAHTSAGESSVSGTPSEEAGAYLRLSVAKPIGKRRNALSVLSTVLLPLMR